MSELSNPITLGISHRTIDIDAIINPGGSGQRRVTEIDVRPSEGNLKVYWVRVR